MADLREFELQVLALGMAPKQGHTLEGIFEKAQQLAGKDDVDLGEPGMKELWSYLRTQKIDLDWPASEYKPEKALQKRTLQLGREAVKELVRRYPAGTDAGFSEKWEHLFLHGKLGLMAALFAIEADDKEAVIGKIAPIIERFMEVIERGFEDLLSRSDRPGLAACLRLEDDPSTSIKDFVRGRLQPFSLARGLYLEKDFSGMRPLSWWVVHERYIPDIPTSRQKGANSGR